MRRTSVPYSDYPSYFGDYGLAQYGAHPQVAKIDALAEGIVTESLGRRTSKTQFWLDRWTPLHEPEGHTLCGALCMADNSLVAHAKSKLGLDLAWRVEVVKWTREKGYGDLKKQARAVLFRD